METKYSAFVQSLDEDTKTVIQRMDDHESLGHAEGSELTQEMADILSTAWSHIEEIAADIASDTQHADQHTETMLLILSYAPNAQSYWFIRELIDKQPEVYQLIYNKVVSQKPLQMSGKLLRERLLFFVSREQIVNFIFSRECRASLMRALKGMKRA